MFGKSKEHLNEVNEGYFEHMYFAMKYSMGCFKAGLFAAIHAIFPALCKNSASEQIKLLYSKLEGRTDND